MRLERFTFGSIGIDGVTYEHDVVIDRGKVRERREAVEAIPPRLRPHAAQSRRRFLGGAADWWSVRERMPPCP
jgi:hypothetical protein